MGNFVISRRQLKSFSLRAFSVFSQHQKDQKDDGFFFARRPGRSADARADPGPPEVLAQDQGGQGGEGAQEEAGHRRHG